VATPSKDYQSFLASLEAPLTTREAFEGFDVGALGRLTGDERKDAQARLIALLEREADPRAVRGLAILPTKAASKALQEAIGRYRGQGEVEDGVAFEALAALVARGELANPVDAYLDFLENGQALSRAGAAEALADHPGERVTDALLGALRDADQRVRSSAAAALFAVSGLHRYAGVVGTELWLLKHWLSLPFPAIRDAATAALKEAVGKLRDGSLGEPPTRKPPESPAMTRFLDSKLSEPGKGQWAETFDVDALRELEGTEKDWAEFSLIAQLGEGDPRVPRALAAMGSTRALEPLRAALGQAKGPLRSAIEAALDVLEDD
jgi:hypothetical protein